MNDIIQNFQFIRPQCLWLFVPIVIGYIIKLKYSKDQNLWQRIIPKHLYQQMIVSKGMHKSNRFMHVAMFGLLTATIAISGPSWEKLPQAVYQTQVGKVILMDMSMSLRATDLSPNRLSRARFKAIDLVNEVKEGETGLVAYSGDAFVVSPLTDDINNLKTLIPVLSPEIMPTQGSSALMGLEQAATLLTNAGYQQGQIYWISDGISYDEIKDIRNFIINSDFDISALLIGTEAGAPITMQDGQLLKDYSGKIVIPSINSRYMNQAMAGTNAQYHLFATDNSDIQAIKMKVEFEQQKQAEAIENITGDELKDMGPYLVLLLLPIAAYAFRKGLLNIAVATFFTSLLLLPNKPAMAQSQALNSSPAPQEVTLTTPSSTAETLVDKVFKNANQRGKLAFDNSDFEKADGLFDNQEWRAASAYKMGDYERAATLYSELLKKDSTNKDNLYNQGNALAKQGKLEEALEVYNHALSVDSEYEQALQNKKIVEDLLKQQSDPNKPQDSNNDQQQGDGEDQQQSEDGENQQQEQSEGGESPENGQQGDQSSEQQSENSQQQSDQQTDSANDEALKQNAQEQAERESQESQSDELQEQEQSQQNNANQQADDQSPSEQEQQAAISNQINADDLSPEQKEEMQRMQMILNKVPDDPAYLLKRKMQLEAYKRKNSPPSPEQENW